ncbi:MAG: tRNA (adenosine(37)-N6)-threonylcarbamoyltransferase complex transferase subunit TsaD [Candidatus Coatesbacteria bacterium]|nr:MAG: tRNA (adenosine(37)-N6)-threonylcarbamoyltransferase complex transferase subunit TsaD [Candidatus Coatesbacteria bacterium]
MFILGIETSCDETAAGVVRDGTETVSNVIRSQVNVHRAYGGVVPELAGRHHVVDILPVVESALEPVGANKLSAVAVTVGPGLNGPLLIGLSFAKAFSFANDLSLYGVNHLAAHIAALHLLDEPPEPPFVVLLVTGGHTALYHVKDWGEYRRLGRTLDDACGEAFDKVARLLGLPYPGGPSVESAAAGGDPAAFPFPRPMTGKGFDFSFAGLKTAVALKVKEYGDKPLPTADFAASFQEAVAETAASKARDALEATKCKSLAVVGGVAANKRLREVISETNPTADVFFPPPELCGDNGAMVAAAGFISVEHDRPLPPGADAVPSLEL